MLAFLQICRAFFRLEVQARLAHWIIPKEHQFISRLALVALLRVDILGRWRKNNHISRLQYTLLDEFYTRLPSPIPCINPTPFLIQISTTIDPNNAPTIMIVDRGHSFRTKTRVHQGQAILFLVNRLRLLALMNIAARFFLPLTNRGFRYQLAHTLGNPLKISITPATFGKDLLNI